MLTELLAFVILVCMFLYLITERRPTNFPPGPSRLPIVGNLHQLTKEPHKAFLKLTETYGNVFSIYFAGYRAVVLNDYKSIKDGMSENAFSSRPPLEAFLVRSGGIPRGVIFTSGQKWTEQRRFIIKNLRDFGFGRKTMETLLQQEIVDLVDTLQKDVGTPIQMQNKFNAAVLNALWFIMTGQRYSHDDPRLNGLIKRLTTQISNSKAAGALLFFPWVIKLRRIFPFLTGKLAKSSKEFLAKTLDFMSDSIREHKESYDDAFSRDFIDVYWKEVMQTKDPSSSFYGDEGVEPKVRHVRLIYCRSRNYQYDFDLGMSPLSFESRIPRQNVCRNQTCGWNAKIVSSLADRPKMPYTEAVIMEVQRYSALAPLGIFHYNTEDIHNFHGYTIPKDTIIVTNLYGALRDPKVWGDPDNFRPERFLSPDRTTLIKHEAFLPFSTGRRVCLGEALAKDELFLFMTSLFQRFKVAPNPDGPPLEIDYHTATILIPKAHELVLHERR